MVPKITVGDRHQSSADGDKMGELIMTAPVAGLTSKNRITAEDVIMLRREVFGDGVVTRGEAEALFALDSTAKDKCEEWPVFFVEAVTDYLVHQEKPAGYISRENADWLVADDFARRHGRQPDRTRTSCACAGGSEIVTEPSLPPMRWSRSPMR